MIEPNAEALGVSRETFEKLEVYANLLKKWNLRINLVSRASVEDLWTRHISDSLQIYRAAPQLCAHWADLGSGGGFPGLIAAICSAGETQFTLVESDQRKSVFLRTVIRELGVSATVVTARIEDTEPLAANVISARALTKLSGLLAFAERHLATDGVAIFPKGMRWEEELFEARKLWHFEEEHIKSDTEAAAVIFKVKGIARV